MGADGRPAHIVLGYLLETDWGAGRMSYDVELCTSHLQPVLYQQVRAAAGGAATVVCDKADFAKRYKAAVTVAPPTVPGEAVPENDKDPASVYRPEWPDDPACDTCGTCGGCITRPLPKHADPCNCIGRPNAERSGPAAQDSAS